MKYFLIVFAAILSYRVAFCLSDISEQSTMKRSTTPI